MITFINLAELSAFDYKTQTWVTGIAAAELQIHQLSQTIDALSGPQRDEFARFHGMEVSAIPAKVAELSHRKAEISRSAMMAILFPERCAS